MLAAFLFRTSNVGAQYGIRKERAVNYCQDEDGIKESYCMMSEAISKVRNKESLDDGAWKKGMKDKQ